MGRLIGSFFGLGLVPKAPGTFGTLGGVLLAWAIPQDGVLLAVAAGVFVLGGLLAPKDDPGWFVLDEVAAYMLVPLTLGREWLVLGLAFACFRLFDIVKPFPIRRLEHVGGKWGVMIDDILAAVYAHALIRGILWLL